jgi:hypothetical protein
MYDSFKSVMDEKGRYMTDHEIMGIINELPPTPSNCKMVSDYDTKVRNNKMYRLLWEVLIIDEIYEVLKETFIADYYDSLIDPGFPKGGVAAGAVSAPATQRNLSAYHVVGVGALGGGSLSQMLEIYMRKKDRNPERMNIHFVNYNMTENDVQEILYRMEGISIQTLLSPTESMEIIKDVPDLYEVAPWIPIWPQYVQNSTEFIENNSGLFFRLKFNVLQLYTYCILLNDIRVFLDATEGVVCVPSPTTIGYIDLFIDHDFVKDKYDKIIPNNTLNKFDLLNIYYREAIMPKFGEALGQKRVPGMKNSTVVEESVIRIMNATEKRERDGRGEPTVPFTEALQDRLEDGPVDKVRASNAPPTSDIWRLYCDATEIRLNGIRDGKIRRLFEECGMTVVESVYKAGEVSYRVYGCPADSTPLDHINNMTTQATENFNEHRNRAFIDKTYDLTMNFELGEVYRASMYCYAVANTDEITRVISYSEVDPDVSMLSNPFKMYRAYGIECGRNVLLREAWNDIVGSGNSVAARNLHTVVESMCYIGAIVPTTSKGNGRIGRETWTNAAFETPLEHIKNAAAVGKCEELKSVSSSIIFGKQVEIGTGLTKIVDDPSIPPIMFDAVDDRRLTSTNVWHNANFDGDEGSYLYERDTRRLSSVEQDETPIRPTNVTSTINFDNLAANWGDDDNDEDFEIAEYDEDYDILDKLFD